MPAAITQTSAPVPGITQQALDAITDPNVRTVLQQMVTGWQVRNGAAGDGSNAFVTRGDLGMSGGGGIGSVGFSAGATIGNTAFLQPGVITSLVNAVEASIMASAFFQSLGTSFDAPSGITKKQTILSNSVGQLSSQVTTLGSSVGTLSAGLTQESTTRANADGQLGAQWSVKTDVNGYIAGFGLASTANNSTPVSAFIVRADEFAIGSPSGPGISPQVPFTVFTTPQTIGGQLVPAGVYITRAFIANGMIDTAAIANAAITQAQIASAAIGSAQIQNAAIQNAHIGYAAVDTLRVAGHAITAQSSWSALGMGASVNYVASGGNLMILAETLTGAEPDGVGGYLSATIQVTISAPGSPNQTIWLIATNATTSGFVQFYNVSGNVTISVTGQFSDGVTTGLHVDNLIIFESLR
jgi:hypothetical protein